MRISDWSSDVCSSDLGHDMGIGIPAVWAVERLPQHGKRLARIIAVVMLAAATAGIAGPALPCIAPDNALGARVFLADLLQPLDLDGRRQPGQAGRPALTKPRGTSQAPVRTGRTC